MAEKTYWMRADADFAPEGMEDVQLVDGALVLREDCYFGQYVTRETAPGPFRALAVSWNAQTPLGADVQVQVRVRAAGEWSPWLDYGLWSTHRACEGKETSCAFARIEEGVVRLVRASADAFQVRAALHANERGDSPQLRALGVSALRDGETWEDGEPLYHRSVPAPGYSAHVRAPALQNTMDLAIAVTALMNRWGEDVLPEETAYACRQGEGSGGAAYAAAYVGSYGYESCAVFCDVARLKAEIKRGFASAVQMEDGRWMCVRGFDTDEDGAQSVFLLDPDAAADAETPCVWTLDELRARWTHLAVLTHERQDVQRPPERIPGELRATDVPGEYALYLKGEAASLPEDGGTIVCYTVRDGHAYATAAHKHFHYTASVRGGRVALDTAGLEEGARLTVYLIRRGIAVVASLTL